MSKEALKLALEALEKISRTQYHIETPPVESLEEQMRCIADKAITAIKQALEQPVQEPVAMDEVRELSDGFIENPEAIKYLLDCLRWAQGEDGLPQTHYNFICAFQRKGYAVLQRLNEDYGPEWTFSKHATTPPAQPAPAQEPVAMRMPKVGDRVVCIDDESLGTVVYLTAGGSPEIKFDDGSHGTYMLREFAELFGYTHPSPAAAVHQTCNCRWDGEVQVQQCTLHQAHVDTIHEWAERAKAAEAKLAAQPAPVTWQHIESAPKDGTRILCQDEIGLVDICEWTEDRFTSSDDRTFGGHLAYTSWTPLPHSGPTLPATQRQWVKLPDDDFQLICTNFRVAYGGWVNMLALEIEAKLKELNT